MLQVDLSTLSSWKGSLIMDSGSINYTSRDQLKFDGLFHVDRASLSCSHFQRGKKVPEGLTAPEDISNFQLVASHPVRTRVL